MVVDKVAECQGDADDAGGEGAIGVESEEVADAACVLSSLLL